MMKLSRTNRIAQLLTLMGLLLYGLLAPAQTRITPQEVCKRNGGPDAGWVYADGICYGPGTHAPRLQDTFSNRVSVSNPHAPDDLIASCTMNHGKLGTCHYIGKHNLRDVMQAWMDSH